MLPYSYYSYVLISLSSYNDIRQGNHTFTPNKDLGIDTLTYPRSEKDIEEDFPVQRADPDFFPHWCYMISFPFLFATLILHLVFHSLFIFGVIVSSLHTTSHPLLAASSAALFSLTIHRATSYWG